MSATHAQDDGSDRTLWKIHDERLVDDTRRLDLRIAHVELPDGVQFEQYVLRMPKAAIVCRKRPSLFRPTRLATVC